MKVVKVGDLVEYHWTKGRIDKGIVIEVNEYEALIKVYWMNVACKEMYWESRDSDHLIVIS